MIRSHKAPVRPVLNPSAIDETNAVSTAGDITSYLGRVLTINARQVLVESILGQGGFAFVFLVRAFNHQRYALKRMYVNNPRDLYVCQREIGLIKELSSHRNIVKYIDSSIQCVSPANVHKQEPDDEDAIYEILLLTEYCSHGSLIARLNEQRTLGVTALNERTILRIFADICHAVSACHYRRPQPVLHRDIKLENILIDAQQCHVLCDFGSAIVLPSSGNGDYQQCSPTQLTTSDIQRLEEDIQRYTTVSYRAPEMIDLYSRTPITLKADIWAMGCLLYKLMYNTMPFGESVLAIQNGTFVIPEELCNAYSREMNLLVRYMLDIEPSKRPDIWQVSYLTYKLLGVACPLPNRCQSKTPDLTAVPMPLTDSESRQQRSIASSKDRSASNHAMNESAAALGTAINPRERPRGMIPPSVSLIDFNQAKSSATAPPVPPAQPSASSSRSVSTAQPMFDDDFSQIPSHAISMTNISTSSRPPRSVSRPRPSPPATISAASGLALQQQLFPMPPPSHSSAVHSHRRSSSQTMNSTNNQSPFPHASSVDQPETSRLPNNHRSQEQAFQRHSDDERDSSSLSDAESHQRGHTSKHHALKKKSRPSRRSNSTSTEEAKQTMTYSTTSDPPTNHLTDNETLTKGFNELINEHSDDDDDHQSRFETTSTHQQPSSSSFVDVNNPFLHAPFHHSPVQKKPSIETSKPIGHDSASNMNSIVNGTRSSAFAPYQRSVGSQPIAGNSVFINAPFKTNLLTNQRSIAIDPPAMASPLEASNRMSYIHSSDEELLSPKTRSAEVRTRLSSEQHAYANLSFNDTTTDEYF